MSDKKKSFLRTFLHTFLSEREKFITALALIAAGILLVSAALDGLGVTYIFSGKNMTSIADFFR